MSLKMSKLVFGTLRLCALLGVMVADPHFVTLDGNIYSFSGRGEFVYLRAGSGSQLLEVQVIVRKFWKLRSRGTLLAESFLS